MEKFEATFDSLRNYQCPEWFRDAKLGIWSHWGPQSVPMFGDWYARNMYIQGTPQYEYHFRHYGHPSRFGYKDVCSLWKAEAFDPDALMMKYEKAGAKFFVSQATHHDHFFNYNSSVNPMNSVNLGPHKDIVALWKEAAAKRGMHFGISEHLAASFSWWRVNKGCDTSGPYAGIPYDGNDPAYRQFYHDNYEHGMHSPERALPWHTKNSSFHAYWLRAVNEMIEQFTPDVLYSDGALPFGECWEEKVNPICLSEYAMGLQAVTNLYNTSINIHGKNQAVYLQKDRRPEIYRVGVLDVERSQLPDIATDPWQTDTCIGNWFYDLQAPYKSVDQIIEMLVDIISKNGVLLLNIPQRPDGKIDEETDYILKGLSEWFSVCGEAVYETRPWHVFGEGTTTVAINGFQEDKTVWNSDDYRFVQKKGRVYVFMLGAKAGENAILRSFSNIKIQSVRLLGGEKLAFEVLPDQLRIKLPDHMPCLCANTLEIVLEG